MCFHDEHGRLRSVPATWTSVVEPDPLLTIAAATSGSEVGVRSACRALTFTRDAEVSTSATVEKIEPPSFSSIRPADCSTSRPRAWLESSSGTITVSPSGMSATASAGLEARVPFLDHEVVELAARIPPELKIRGGGKWVLKEGARRLIPADVIDRPKGYFPVPALKHLHGPYLDLVADALHSTAARDRGLFTESEVSRLLADPNGNLTRQTDARGQRICFYYDALDRLTGKHYRTDDACPASPPIAVAYYYDQGTNGKGLRTGIQNWNELILWQFDARGLDVRCLELQRVGTGGPRTLRRRGGRLTGRSDRWARA